MQRDHDDGDIHGEEGQTLGDKRRSTRMKARRETISMKRERYDGQHVQYYSVRVRVCLCTYVLASS